MFIVAILECTNACLVEDAAISESSKTAPKISESRINKGLAQYIGNGHNEKHEENGRAYLSAERADDSAQKDEFVGIKGESFGIKDFPIRWSMSRWKVIHRLMFNERGKS